jgi:hypothetical protein
MDCSVITWSCEDVLYQVIQCGLVDWVMRKTL